MREAKCRLSAMVFAAEAQEPVIMYLASQYPWDLVQEMPVAHTVGPLVPGNTMHTSF